MSRSAPGDVVDLEQVHFESAQPRHWYACAALQQKFVSEIERICQQLLKLFSDCPRKAVESTGHGGAFWPRLHWEAGS